MQVWWPSREPIIQEKVADVAGGDWLEIGLADHKPNKPRSVEIVYGISLPALRLSPPLVRLYPSHCFSFVPLLHPPHNFAQWLPVYVESPGLCCCCVGCVHVETSPCARRQWCNGSVVQATLKALDSWLAVVLQREASCVAV
jgi:hypothetical protein